MRKNQRRAGRAKSPWMKGAVEVCSARCSEERRSNDEDGKSRIAGIGDVIPVTVDMARVNGLTSRSHPRSVGV